VTVTKFTDATVRTLPPGLHYDEHTPGFGIRVGTRRRTWVVVRGKRRTQTTLGHYPYLSLQDARKKAYGQLSAIEEIKATITVPEAKEAYLAQGKWRPQSRRVLASSLKHFAWQGRLTKVSHEMVVDALNAIEAPSARAHALKDVRSFFNWCIPRYLASSPAAGIKMAKQPSRDRVLTDDELRRVWIAAEQMGQFGVMVRLLILTGQRRSEIGGLRPSMIETDQICLPPALTKNGHEHFFPLLDLARSLLPPRTNGFLFPNENGGSFTSWSKNHAALLKRSATSSWTLHDLRRTFATGLAKQGTPIHVTEKILNHVSGALSGVAGIYNRFDYWDERIAAMKAWEERISLIARQ